MNRQRVLGVAVIGIVSFVVYVGIRFVLPLFVPFFFAFLAVLIINPLINRIHRRLKVNKGALAAVILALICGLLGGILWYFGDRLLFQIKTLADNSAYYCRQFRGLVNQCCCGLEDMTGIRAESLERVIIDNVYIFVDRMQVNLLPEIMSNSFGYLKNLIAASGVSIIVFISIVLLAKDFDELKEKNSQYFYYNSIRRGIKRFLDAGGTFMKAQLIIMAIIMAVCAAGFFLLGNPYALLIGIGIGFLDALPVFGTGIVLIPLAIIQLIFRNFLPAAAFLSLYIICSVIREFLEPKLIGKSLGIPSILILVSVYVGIRLFGITGVITGPIAYLLIKEICMALFDKYNLSLKEQPDSSGQEKNP